MDRIKLAKNKLISLTFFSVLSIGILVFFYRPPPPALAPLPHQDVVSSDGPFSAIWAQDGLYKVPQESLGLEFVSPLWDGQKIRLEAARNEVVGFALVLETKFGVNDVQVVLSKLEGNQRALRGASRDDVDWFNYVDREIELFRALYLPIRGLSFMSYDVYDERHIPERLRRPHDHNGKGRGNWKDRPDADKHYPEIALPISDESRFKILPGNTQTIWVDVYIPKNADSNYSGKLTIKLGLDVIQEIPISVLVHNIELPDVGTSKNMVYIGYSDLNLRYSGTPYPNEGTPEERFMRQIRDRHFLVAKRHRIALIDENPGPRDWPHNRPRPDWIPRLDGTLFTPQNGYEGPGVATPNGVYSIGTYGKWTWRNGNKNDMHRHTDAWVQWFRKYAPDNESFLYLIDESKDYPTTEKWANWARSNPGPGRELKTFATLPLPDAVRSVPNLSVGASWFAVADPNTWLPALKSWRSEGRQFWMYNGKRPASGSFATEDDGVALRSIPWIQFRHGIERWFYWEATYYNNFQGGTGQTNVYRQARTFGAEPKLDPVLGEVGPNSANGDGVLFYPGMDRVYPDFSPGLPGPLSSLRLKFWRTGIQDAELLKLATRVDPERVKALINRMIPKSLWEYGVSDPSDPTWVRTDVSWPNDPVAWQEARLELFRILDN